MYTHEGQIVNDKWIKVQPFGLFLNWDYPEPYRPYVFTRSMNQMMSCVNPGNPIDPGDTWNIPEIPEGTLFANIQISVRNKFGIEKQMHWPIYVDERNCS